MRVMSFSPLQQICRGDILWPWWNTRCRNDSILHLRCRWDIL